MILAGLELALDKIVGEPTDANGNLGQIYEKLPLVNKTTAELLSNGKTQTSSCRLRPKVTPYRNEVQRLSHNGSNGSFTLSYGGKTTTDLSFAATADDVQDALNAIGIAGGVTVTRNGDRKQSLERDLQQSRRRRTDHCRRDRI